MTAEQQRAMLEELARQRMAMGGMGPPMGAGRSPDPAPAPGLSAYAQPPPNTPASPSWFGPAQPTPAGLPPAPVPPPCAFPEPAPA